MQPSIHPHLLLPHVFGVSGPHANWSKTKARARRLHNRVGRKSTKVQSRCLSHLISSPQQKPPHVLSCVCVYIYMPCTPTNTFPLRMQANPQIGQRTCHSNFTTFKAPWVGGSPRLPTLGAFSNIYPQFSC